MRPRLLRILLGIEYLIAVQVLIAFWSHAGGQYHIELMFWPWKIAIPLAGAALVVAMTSGLARGLRWTSARILLMEVSLLLLMLVAGLVTYYYHVNEPTDQDDEDQPAQITRTRLHTADNGGQGGRLWTHFHTAHNGGPGGRLWTHFHTAHNGGPGGRLCAHAGPALPGPAGFSLTADHGSVRLASERLLKFRHVGNHAVDPEFRK